MNKELEQKIAPLSLLGYYDENLKMLCVHFFGDGEKNDLMAYLLNDLSWELREVLSEKSELYSCSEIITITHSVLGSFACGSKFDEFVRSALIKLSENENFKDKKVEEILKNGYKNN